MEERQAIQEPPKKWATDPAHPPKPTTAAASTGCFDCNICLEYAVEPVVTLCGHLYCWPCIYKWLELDSTAQQQCPVCKAALSETTLVPLYGRGNGSNQRLDIPRRPSVQHRGRTIAASLVEPNESHQMVQHRRRHHHSNNQMAGHNYSMSLRGIDPVLGSTAIAVLPWVFGDHVSTELLHPNPYYLMGGENSPGLQRQEMKAKRSLHRISIFLFCCVVLCLLLF